MSADLSPETPLHQPDDGFWSALFQQEAAATDTPHPHDALPPTSERWSGLSERLDGRFRWADGGSPVTHDPWQTAQAHFQDDEAIDVIINGHNKGGLLTNWNGLQGFIPASQLIDFPQFHLESERINALKKWHGRTLTVKIIELNPTMNRLIFSERAALVDADQRDQIFAEVNVDDVIEGEVTNLTNFGAFVDLGGVEGLIHISELSWSRVTHPSQIVKPGQTVRVRVLNIDPDQERIALSLKRLKKNPWQTVEHRYQPDQIIEGVVSNVVSFGAFVQIEDELEGLIHISELAEGSFLHPRDVVRRGERVRARILHVDGKDKRLALSLRGLKPD